MEECDNISAENLDHARSILNSAKTKKGLTTLNKNGQKLNHQLNTQEEANCLQTFYEKFHKHNTHLKTAKLGALGIAEWLPDLQVAKIVKEGKFVHYMGRQHVEKFPFLFAEEALYLLDTGDIELRLNQLPLSLQDAFCLLTCSEKEKDNLLCTLDEYYVFAWFMKAGYALQRCPIPSVVKKRVTNVVPKEKGPVDILQSCTTSQGVEVGQLMENGTSSTEIKEDGRPWGSLKDIIELLKKKELEMDAKIRADKELIGPKPPSFCDIINDAIPDNLNFSYEPPDWKTYKAKQHELKTRGSRRANKNSHIFTKGNTKPLIGSWEESLYCSSEVLGKLKIFNQTSEVIDMDNKLRVTFSVYKREGKFSKTNPGIKFCKLVIVKPNSPMLSFEQVSQLQKDDPVPIRIAIVSNGSVNFVDVNNVEIPDSVFLG